MSFRISSFIAAVSSRTTARASKRISSQERIARPGGAAALKSKPEDVDAARSRKHRPTAIETVDPQKALND